MSQQINLVNPLFLKQTKYFSAVAMAEGVALLVLGLGVVYGFVLWERGSLDRSLAETRRQHAVQQERFNKLSAELSPAGAEQEMDARLQAAEKDLAARRTMLAQLSAGTLEATNGYSALLTAFARQSINGLWLTGIAAGTGGHLMVRGRALQAELLPVYIQRLGREEVLKGRPFEKLELAQKQLAEQKAALLFVEFALSSENAVRQPHQKPVAPTSEAKQP